MNLYQPRYVENLTEAFNKTQNFEQERMLFFKQVFLECHELMQVHQDERFDELFDELLQKINSINPQEDIEWWSEKYGNIETIFDAIYLFKILINLIIAYDI